LELLIENATKNNKTYLQVVIQQQTVLLHFKRSFCA